METIRTSLALPDKLSVAVLPFINMSADPEATGLGSPQPEDAPPSRCLGRHARYASQFCSKLFRPGRTTLRSPGLLLRGGPGSRPGLVAGAPGGGHRSGPSADIMWSGGRRAGPHPKSPAGMPVATIGAPPTLNRRGREAGTLVVRRVSQGWHPALGHGL
jgi:hypothetical protein